MDSEDLVVILEILIFLIFTNKFLNLITKTLEIITAEIFL